MDVHLHGVGHTPFGRHHATLETLALEAFERLHDTNDAPLPEPDHLLVASQAPGAFSDVANTAAAVADALGLAGLPATRVETGPSSSLAAVEMADALVRSGNRESVLIVGVETMTRLTTDATNRVLARMASRDERSLGLTMAAQVALMARAYLERHDVPREALADCAVKAHAHGALNPIAHLRKPLTRDQVLAAPTIADPLGRYDCAPLSDGAVCLLVAKERGPLRLTGIGHATDHLSLTHRNHHPDALTAFPATTRAAQEALQRARCRIHDMDIVETHDAFSLLEGMNLEDLGIYPRGDGVTAVAGGETAIGGPHPTNVGGGLKARGHPVGATGAAQLAELFWQITGHDAALARSVEAAKGRRPRRGLAHNIGGLGNNVHTVIVEATS